MPRRLAVLLVLATAAAAADTDAPGSHAGHAASGSTSPPPPIDAGEPCYAQPGDAACETYTRPDGAWEGDVKALCAAMAYMPGCSLWRECQVRGEGSRRVHLGVAGGRVEGGRRGGAREWRASAGCRLDRRLANHPKTTPRLAQAASTTSSYCAPSSLTATLCTDMPRMNGCVAHGALCGAGSKVPACSSPGPLPSAPSTTDAESAVRSMCASHGMPGCDACTGSAGTKACPDPLSALATVCASMPGMSACAPLAAACGAEGAAALFPKTCALVGGWSGGGHGSHASTRGAVKTAADFTLPPMRMWLHADAEDAVLSRHWVPRTPANVAAACVGTIAAAMVTQALRAGRALAEAHWATHLKTGATPPTATGRLARNAVRAAATIAVSLLDLLLMLIAMTFSWPLILSVAGGYALGALLLGHVGERGAPGGPAIASACNGSASVSNGGAGLVKGSPVLGAGGCCDLSGGVGQGVKPGV